MTKRELSAILAKASKEEVSAIADPMKVEHEIQMMKEPQKTLVMVKVRESVKNSLFYLGEVLVTECMVMVDGKKGVSVVAGDEYEKAIGIAIIDGYLNGEHCKETVIKKIEQLEKRQKQAREQLNRQLRKSKVNFNVMGE